MSKANAIFAVSLSPMKTNVKSSPAPSRSNGSAKGKNQQTTLTVTESSPRKCRIQTEVRSSPIGARGTNINVKSKLQITEMSSRMNNKEQHITKPSPRKEQTPQNNNKEVKKQTSGSKALAVTGVVQLHNSRDNKATVRKGLFEGPNSSDVPSNVNVKNMRSCFERKENKVPSKPPPSPSPSRPKPPSSTMKNNSNNIKGILSSRSKFDNSPSKFRVPTSPRDTPTPQRNKLRRSVSTGTLASGGDIPSHPGLLRSHSQHTMTPKLRVRFRDEAPGCFSPVLLDAGSGDSVAGESTNLTVAVRLRPPFPGERSVVAVDGRTVKVRAPGAEHCFSYDYCFCSTGENAATQEQVFDTMVEPLVEAAFQSYNVCLFAYGQTGSGKSYSMMGEEITSSDDVPEKAGIIPRFSQRIFKIIESCKEYSSTQIEISYFEIYNEKIHDLLGTSVENGRGAPLRVREHPELGPYVVDLNVRQVTSYKSLQDWLRLGKNNKATAATEMNENSSRSHSIFTITLTQSQDDERPSVCSKINLVDLAGSERLAHTCASGDRLKEGVSINRSLLTLGKVISSLAENKRGFIPYRESVLTWLLRESLGGNSRTAMLATISPSSQFVEETLATLRYACQARNIVNTVRTNERPHERRIRELTEEIQQLRDGFRSVDHAECDRKIATLQEELDLTKYSQNECEQKLDTLQEELKLTKHNHDECEQKLLSLQEELKLTKHNYRDCEHELVALQEELKHTKHDHNEYEQKLLNLQEELNLTKHKLAKAEFICSESEKEVAKLEKEWEETQSLDFHAECKSKIENFEREISKVECANLKLEREIKELRKECLEDKEAKFEHEIEIKHLKEALEDLYGDRDRDREKIRRLENELENAERLKEELKCKNVVLEKEVNDCRKKNHGYEKDISEMKKSMLEIKKNSSHEPCESQILMLQTALDEAERFTRQFQEKAQILEKKCTEMKSTSNHEGCEKEICALKETIKELKQSANHSNCDKVIEKLKTSLSGAEKIISDLQNEVDRVREEKSLLETTKDMYEKETISLRNALSQLESSASHKECEEKLDTLKKALAVAKSMNAHVQCENRIYELEMEIRNLQSVTLADHSACDEKVSNLFYAVEKYAGENNRLVEKHKEEIDKYTETISSLKEKLSSLTSEIESKENIRRNTQDIMHLEGQLKLLKDENSKLKKKKVEDEKRVSSLEQQVISLTKELLEVKNQLRASIREKDSSESLCTQLQEQLLQQDRKLASSQSSCHIDDDKENWETPSKVIRRSIAQHSKTKRSARCSFAMRADEIQQSLKDAEDICSRLKIPWVFQLEPEVTTHSWFDVNVRVWDQRTMSSVRWPQDVFLGWLREMKDTILSKSRGHKLFHSATWMQNSKEPQPLPLEPVSDKKMSLEEEVDQLQGRIMALEELCDPGDRHQVLSAITSLGKAVTQLSSKLGLSSPLKPSNARRKL